MAEAVESITIQKMDTQNGFIFRGGLLGIDLVNTEIVERGQAFDLLDSPQALVRWWKVVKERYPETALLQTGEEFTFEQLAATKILRAAIHQLLAKIVLEEEVVAADLAEVNRALAMAHQSVEINIKDLFQSRFRFDEGTSPLLFYVALSIFDLLTQNDLARLHKCDNPRCVLYFYDTTKSATRRWCSTDCQNRVRSSENYRRRKEAAHL